ncbi:MAG: NAD(+)/NADH kinase [Spirochaetia bacterium]
MKNKDERPEIRKVLIIANLLKPKAEELIQEIEHYLSRQSIESFIYRYKGTPQSPIMKNADLAISLGGDGTVLFSSRVLASVSIPVLAVNLGDFGFIAEVARDEWQEAFEKYRDGRLGVSKRLMLQVSVFRNGKNIGCFKGLNDAVICAAGISKLVKLNVELTGISLGHFRADGMIIATPTGSTAYSISAGGPILNPEMAAMIINPICPFTLSNRPIVVPGEEEIHICIEEHQRTQVILTVDGQNAFPLQPLDVLKIENAAEQACIIRSDKRTFYEVLRSKLNWSGGPNNA